MEAVKGESVLWTKSSTGLPFSYSPSSHPWPSSFGPFLFPSVVPFAKWYPLIGFQAQHFLYLLDSGLILQCIRCLLESISVVNSWFWRVKSAMAAAMDCTCWTEDGCITGADWRSRWGLVEASLLSWWSGLVALDLVWTIQPFVVKGQIVRQTSFPQMTPTDNSQKISKLDGANFDDLEGLKKKENKDQRRPGLTGHKSSDDEVSSSLPKI